MSTRRTSSAAAAAATATARCVIRSMRITLLMLQVVLPLAAVILRNDKLPLAQSALLSSSPMPRIQNRPQLLGRTKFQRRPGNGIPSLAFLSSSSSSTSFPSWFGRGSSSSSSSSSSERTRLYGRAIKRSSLGKEITSSALDKNKSNSSSGSNKKKTKKKGAAAGGGGGETTGISPALAEWMAKGGEAAAAAVAEEEEEVVVESSSERTTQETIGAAEFVPFDDTTDNDDDTKDDDEEQQEGTETLVEGTGEKGKSEKKRNKKKDTNKSVRKAQDAIKRSIIQSAVSELKELFSDEDNEKKKKKRKMELSDILDRIRALIHVDNPASGLRVITAGSSRERNYRMAWVGSDDAICHVGTGLHKVPLARLQEVFLTMGKNRVEILEVIRILGPFPNVKNTIRGDISIVKPSRGTSLSSPSSARTKLRIVYDSMIDGTGKEILAGTEENTRVVDLDVLFADESAIVCMVPPSEEEKQENNEKEKKVDDPLSDNGSKVILFLPEDDLDRKLEMLRVA